MADRVRTKRCAPTCAGPDLVPSHRLRKGSTVATVGAAVKFPTGKFINDAEVVPVGEGQYDIDLRVGALLGLKSTRQCHNCD